MTRRSPSTCRVPVGDKLTVSRRQQGGAPVGVRCGGAEAGRVATHVRTQGGSVLLHRPRTEKRLDEFGPVGLVFTPSAERRKRTSTSAYRICLLSSQSDPKKKFGKRARRSSYPCPLGPPRHHPSLPSDSLASAVLASTDPTAAVAASAGRSLKPQPQPRAANERRPTGDGMDALAEWMNAPTDVRDGIGRSRLTDVVRRPTSTDRCHCQCANCDADRSSMRA